MKNKNAVYYVAFLITLTIVSISILLYYDVYLFGTPATVHVYVTHDCQLCGKFLSFVQDFLEKNGYKVNICYIDSNNNCRKTFDFLEKTGLPYIVPTSIVFREGKPRGIVLGDWTSESFWEILRDTQPNSTKIIPVFKWGDLVGYIRIDNCIYDNIYDAFQHENPEFLEKQCSWKPLYIDLGAYIYRPPQFP